MISTHKAQEIMSTTRNPLVLSLCETIVDLWKMFGEANCDAVTSRDELEAFQRTVAKIEPAPVMEAAE